MFIPKNEATVSRLKFLDNRKMLVVPEDLFFNQVNWTLVIWLKSNFKSNKETGNSLGSSDKTVLILRHNVIKKSVTILFIFHFCNTQNCFIA